jgi:hypothetical protein
MQYQVVGENGMDFTVIIKRDQHYTNITIKQGSNIIYEDNYLPCLKTQIEAEDNAERIATSWIAHYQKTIGPTSDVKQFP